jgi:hypothetical protein
MVGKEFMDNGRVVSAEDEDWFEKWARRKTLSSGASIRILVTFRFEKTGGEKELVMKIFGEDKGTIGEFLRHDPDPKLFVYRNQTLIVLISEKVALNGMRKVEPHGQPMSTEQPSGITR